MFVSTRKEYAQGQNQEMSILNYFLNKSFFLNLILLSFYNDMKIRSRNFLQINTRIYVKK